MGYMGILLSYTQSHSINLRGTKSSCLPPGRPQTEKQATWAIPSLSKDYGFIVLLKQIEYGVYGDLL